VFGLGFELAKAEDGQGERFKLVIVLFSKNILTCFSGSKRDHGP
jgi:hypothetical protein